MTPAARGSAAGGGYEAVLFDALGTLVELEPPWPLLRAALADSHGIEVDEAEAKEAMIAEMTYYKAHHMEGSDEASLAALRARCAAVLRDDLPPPRRSATEQVTERCCDSLRFTPYPDAAPALGRLRSLGIRSAVVSNWDVSLRARPRRARPRRAWSTASSCPPRSARQSRRARSSSARCARCRARRARRCSSATRRETDVAGALGAGLRAVLRGPRRRAGRGSRAWSASLRLRASTSSIAPPAFDSRT